MKAIWIIGNIIKFLPEKSLLTEDFINEKVTSGLYRYEWSAIYCWNNVLRKERKKDHCKRIEKGKIFKRATQSIFYTESNGCFAPISRG